MDTQLIVEFVELAKRLNVTETARALNMSQPTLSKHINSLETTLRFKLFERSPSGFRLTRAGIDLLPHAYELVEKQNAFFEEAKRLRNAPLPRLSIGGLINEEPVTEALGRVISGMSETCGSNFLELKYAHHKTGIALLAERVVDIFFDFVDEDDLAGDSEIDSILISKIPWVAVVSKDNPLASLDAIHIDNLQECTLLKMEGTHMAAGWERIEKICAQHGFEPAFRRRYSMKNADLLFASANLGNDVMLLGANFVQRIHSGSVFFAKAIPVVDEDAFLPVSAVFRMDNHNPILPEALDYLMPPEGTTG